MEPDTMFTLTPAQSLIESDIPMPTSKFFSR